MKRTGEPQRNTRIYWNYIYNTIGKDDEYWRKTSRFWFALEFVKDKDKFLDIGCGVGVLCDLVKKERKGCEIWGTDISDDAIKNNKKEKKGINFLHGYAGYQDKLPDNYFDVVFAGEIIEHMDDPSLLFKEAHRILKKKGKLIITTPIEDHVTSQEHVWYFDKDDMEKLYFDAGFKKIKFVKMPDMEHLLVFFVVGIK